MRSRIQAAVERALLERHVSARRASLDVVGNDGLIRDIRAGRLPGVDRLEALFEYLGLEFYLGPKRKQGAYGFAEPPPVMDDLARREAVRAGYLPIPWHSAVPRLAGEPTAPVAFSRTWLASAGLDPSVIAAVKPTSAATEEAALIDISAPRQDGPDDWAVRDGSTISIARVQFEPDMILLLPEEPDGRVRVLQGEDRSGLALLGRVVWRGQLSAKGGPIAP